MFLTAEPETAPTSLLHNLKHNKVLHERNIILTVMTSDVPRVDPQERTTIKVLSETFTQVIMRFGYMEVPNVIREIVANQHNGMPFEVMQTSFFLSRRALRTASDTALPLWQNRLFIALTGVSDDAARYFALPTDRVVEIGAQVTV